MAPSTEQGYARPDLLAEPDWVRERREDARVTVIDCASQDAYGRAHIPGAVGFLWMAGSRSQKAGSM